MTVEEVAFTIFQCEVGVGNCELASRREEVAFARGEVVSVEEDLAWSRVEVA